MKKDIEVQKTVVMIGDFIHEGIRAMLEAYEFNFYIRRMVRRKSKTIDIAIKRIEKEFLEGTLANLVVYLPTPTLLYLCTDEFISSKYQLIDTVSKFNGTVFMHKSNLLRDFSVKPRYLERMYDFFGKTGAPVPNDPFEYWLSQRDGTLPELPTVDEKYPEVVKFVDYIREKCVNLVSFQTRNEVTMQIIDLLNKSSSGEFLKIFISNEKYQAEQIEKLIRLLEKYLQSAEKIDFRLNTQKIGTGTIVTFNSISGIINLENFNTYLERFQDFMNICQEDPNEAEKMLISAGINKQNATFTVKKYSTDYRRIMLDARQELEFKLLSLKQRLEQDVFELTTDELRKSSEKIDLTDVFNVLGKSKYITINVAESIINNQSEEQTIVNQTVSGNIEYNEFDTEILKFFEEHAEGLKKLTLQSDLAEVKSKNVESGRKKTARQRIVSFLLNVGSKVGNEVTDTLIKALVAYLEQLVSGKAN